MFRRVECKLYRYIETFADMNFRDLADFLDVLGSLYPSFSIIIQWQNGCRRTEFTCFFLRKFMPANLQLQLQFCNFEVTGKILIKNAKIGQILMKI